MHGSYARTQSRCPRRRAPGAPPWRQSVRAAGRHCNGCVRKETAKPTSMTITATTEIPWCNERHPERKLCGPPTTLPRPPTAPTSSSWPCPRTDSADVLTELRRRTTALGSGGVAGQRARAGHQHADVPDRRGNPARASGRHPGRTRTSPARSPTATRPPPCWPCPTSIWQRDCSVICSAPSASASTPPTTCIGVEIAGAHSRTSLPLRSAWATRWVSARTPAPW